MESAFSKLLAQYLQRSLSSRTLSMSTCRGKQTLLHLLCMLKELLQKWILQILVEMSYFQNSHERDSSFTENLQNVLKLSISYGEGDPVSLLRQHLFP